MYRVKSNTKWTDLGGAVCAYQSISAPDPFAARQNVAHQGARFGVYTATPGVLPAWSATPGWTFNGTTQYLKSGVVQTSTAWSALVRFSGYSGSTSAPLLSAVIPAGPARSIQLAINAATANRLFFANGGTPYLESSPQLSSGVIGVSEKTAYRNGISAGTIAAGSSATWLELYIGAANVNGIVVYGASAISAVIIVSRPMSPAEVWLASRQMAYCEANPDWNAWARRRRYFYAPSVAATYANRLLYAEQMRVMNE